VTPAQALVLAVAGAAAGAVNAVAGGGSLISFPALLGVGLGSVPANVTNTVALWPGYLGGALGYRGELAAMRERLLPFLAISVIGGTAGAVLLLSTPVSIFSFLVPWLVLTGTALFAFQPLLARRVRATRVVAANQPAEKDVREQQVAGLQVAGQQVAGQQVAGQQVAGQQVAGQQVAGQQVAGQQVAGQQVAGQQVGERHPSTLVTAGVLLTSVYGAYFGAGLGVMLLAVLGIFRRGELQEFNALKNSLSLSINTVALIAFALFGPVDWIAVLIMALASLVGGYGGALLARRLPPVLMRTFVIVFGLLVSAKLLVG
jgi:uncharacterized membrane protein YfcA